MAAKRGKVYEASHPERRPVVNTEVRDTPRTEAGRLYREVMRLRPIWNRNKGNTAAMDEQLQEVERAARVLADAASPAPEWRCSTCATEHDETMPHDDEVRDTPRTFPCINCGTPLDDCWTTNPCCDDSDHPYATLRETFAALRAASPAPDRGLREALARFLRRTGGLVVRFDEGRGYVRVPSDWLDDLRAFFTDGVNKGISVKNSPAPDRPGGHEPWCARDHFADSPCEEGSHREAASPAPDRGLDVERLTRVFSKALLDQDFTGFRNWPALAADIANRYEAEP